MQMLPLIPMLVGQGALRAEEPRRMFAAGPAQAYYMEPPELVTRAFVNRIVWTSDGSTVLARRLVPPAGTSPLAIADARQSEDLDDMMRLRPRVQLVAWSKPTRTARVLLDFDSARTMLHELTPMPASDRVLVLLSETTPLPDGTLSKPREAYSLLSVSTGASVRLWTASEPGEATTSIVMSPKRPLGAIVRGSDKSPRRTVSLFGPDGHPGPEFPLLGRRFGFAADGGPGIAVFTKDAKGKFAYGFYRMNPSTGALGTPATEEGYDEAVPTAGAPSGTPKAQKGPPLSVMRTGPPQGEAGIFLHVDGGKREELGLVSVDGTMPLLSPRNDAVAYLLDNAAFVRTLVKIDRGGYDTALREGEKRKAMVTAKQIGTALKMYGMDADGQLPMSDQKDSLDPYLRERSMLAVFAYTFGGGDPSKSGDPSMVELGYVAGPSGRAVVYADGSVRWVPDGF